VEEALNSLTVRLTDTITRMELQKLQSLVNEKIAFTNEILTAYASGGKERGEAVINTGRGTRIRDSIVAVIGLIDNTRQNHVQRLTSQVEMNGQRARFWGFLLAAIACIASVLTFLYIVNKGRQQQRSIAMLNESEKKVKEVAKVKEQFLANMSHEIRTPMNAILGFTNLLRKTDLDSQQLQYVEYIYSSSENLLTLINDILDLSKIEAGMMHIEEVPFSLNGLVNSVEVMFREKARQKGLHFRVEVEESLHDTLSGDPVRLTQILINLLSNAVKFTEKGSVKMEVSGAHRPEDWIMLRFVVTDTGYGIPPEKIRSIFDRFQQAEPQTTRRFGGTGLGLSIVKQLVDLQGGTVDVKSGPGKGSAFVVELPFRMVQHHEFMPATVLLPEHDAIRNARILVAEDNQMNQQLIRHLMKQWSLDFTLVNNGREVLQALKKKAYSLILMDIQMPEMDGYDTTLAIRNELKLDLPIIAMTAHAMVGEKERCLSFGMNDYISKPIRDAELYQILKQYTEGRTVDTGPEGMIDLQYLRDLSGGDAEFEQAIIRQFIVQVPEELQHLREAVDKRNLLHIKNLSHGMKSSVAYMGLTEKLHPYLQRMESEAVDDVENDHFEEDLTEVEAVCEQAVREARQLLQVFA
jgi:signal transduction histidine kinase/CheY-like chemotaxis protein